MSDSEELMQDRDRIEAYRQLKDRCDKLGYASVNHALDELERRLARARKMCADAMALGWIKEVESLPSDQPQA